MKLNVLAILIISSVYSTKAIAQKNVETQHLLWTGYSLKLPIAADWKFKQEIENRQYWFPYNQHQFITRSHVERDSSDEFSTAAGFTYFRQSLPQDPYYKDLTVRTELRPQIEMLYKQALNPSLELTNRLWTEFRFFEQNNTRFRFENARLRYKLELQYNLTENWRLKLFNEILLNAGKNIVYNVFDQNRAGVSGIYELNNNVSLELGYFNWYQQRATGVDFYNRHIIRFTVHHNLNAFKSSEN